MKIKVTNILISEDNTTASYTAIINDKPVSGQININRQKHEAKIEHLQASCKLHAILPEVYQSVYDIVSSYDMTALTENRFDLYPQFIDMLVAVNEYIKSLPDTTRRLLIDSGLLCNEKPSVNIIANINRKQLEFKMVNILKSLYHIESIYVLNNSIYFDCNMKKRPLQACREYLCLAKMTASRQDSIVDENLKRNKLYALIKDLKAEAKPIKVNKADQPEKPKVKAEKTRAKTKAKVKTSK